MNKNGTKAKGAYLAIWPRPVEEKDRFSASVFDPFAFFNPYLFLDLFLASDDVKTTLPPTRLRLPIRADGHPRYTYGQVEAPNCENSAKNLYSSRFLG